MSDQLADKEEIRRLISTYCILHDNKDFDRLTSLFLEDGIFDSSVKGDVKGRKAIAAFYRSIIPAQHERDKRKHFVTDIMIDMKDDNRAVATSSFLLVRQSEGNITIAAVGRYHDLVRRVDNTWFFAHRTVHLDMKTDLGLKSSG